MRKISKKQIWICLAAASLTLLGLLSGCGKKSSDIVKDIQDRGTVRVALCENSSLTQEKDLITKIAGALAVTPEYVKAADQTEAVNLVKEGSADIAVGMIPKSRGAEEGTALTVSYASNSYYVVTRRGDYSNSLAAYAGRNLSVSSDAKTFQIPSGSEGNMPVQTFFSSPQDTMNALKSGDTDGYVCHLDEAVRLAGSDDALQFQNLLAVEAEQYVMVIKKETGRFLGGINSVVDEAAKTK